MREFIRKTLGLGENMNRSKYKTEQKDTRRTDCFHIVHAAFFTCGSPLSLSAAQPVPFNGCFACCCFILRRFFYCSHQRFYLLFVLRIHNFNDYFLVGAKWRICGAFTFCLCMAIYCCFKTSPPVVDRLRRSLLAVGCSFF